MGEAALAALLLWLLCCLLLPLLPQDGGRSPCGRAVPCGSLVNGSEHRRFFAAQWWTVLHRGFVLPVGLLVRVEGREALQCDHDDIEEEALANSEHTIADDLQDTRVERRIDDPSTVHTASRDEPGSVAGVSAMMSMTR